MTTFQLAGDVEQWMGNKTLSGRFEALGYQLMRYRAYHNYEYCCMQGGQLVENFEDILQAEMFISGIEFLARRDHVAVETHFDKETSVLTPSIKEPNSCCPTCQFAFITVHEAPPMSWCPQCGTIMIGKKLRIPYISGSPEVQTRLRLAINGTPVKTSPKD